ncbi:helix-turn-helix domain-containing protein [Streptomyces sp. NPDC004726]
MTALKYVIALRGLRDWSGLTYRQLAERAEVHGESLPPSTLAAALHRVTVPRAELVAALVRAVGLDDAAVDCWLRARERAREGAVEGGSPPEADAAETADAEEPGQPGEGAGATSPEAAAGTPGAAGAARAMEAKPVGDEPGMGSRRGRTVLIGGAAVLALSLAVGVGVKIGESTSSPGDGNSSKAKGSGRPTPLPEEGWHRMRPQHVAKADLCVGEGRERNGRTRRPLAVLRPCDGTVPRTYLKRISEGVYQIQWHPAKESVGCLTVDAAYKVAGALLAPAYCTGVSHQRFAIEPAPGEPGRDDARTYRIRPLHSNLCLGVLGGEADTGAGAELAQGECDGGTDEHFAFEPSG